MSALVILGIALASGWVMGKVAVRYLGNLAQGIATILSWLGLGAIFVMVYQTNPSFNPDTLPTVVGLLLGIWLGFALALTFLFGSRPS